MSKKNFIRTFILGILAGSAIGLGGLFFTVLASVNNKIVGSLLFSIGLLLVCSFSLYLYTGKIGFLSSSENKKKYTMELLTGILGNLIGAVIFGYLIRLMFWGSKNDTMLNTIDSICSSRFIDLGNGGTSWYVPLISSIFCGMLVYIAVYGWKQDWHPLLKVIVLIFSVFAFVAMGFEHCIANMFYLSFGNAWNIQTILNILIVIIGNSLGAIILNLLVTYLKK